MASYFVSGAMDRSACIDSGITVANFPLRWSELPQRVNRRALASPVAANVNQQTRDIVAGL
jgi:hypothetical protein